jgi:hypothetical protein
MKLFSCQACGQVVYFENIACERCGRALGYLPEITQISAGSLPEFAQISALEPLGEPGRFRALANEGPAYKYCANARFGVCNWLIPADDQTGFCAACRHNHVIPDLTVPGNDRLWGRIEIAKHRLFYSLLRMGLPLDNRTDDPEHGLAFDFLADPSVPHAQGVMTGHANGLITLALKEADDAVREKVRSDMGEPYRTLLGHFRHEIGHYFWDRLIAHDAEKLAAFRLQFGDERADYDAALKRHYGQGASPGWQENYVSLYATAHPWEDFAETWAHYMHIVDTLETAGAFGIKVRPQAGHGEIQAAVNFDPYRAASIRQLIDNWLPIAFAVNSLNRSMGHPDFYPFVLAERPIEKLGFIHALTHPKLRLKKSA